MKKTLMCVVAAIMLIGCLFGCSSKAQNSNAMREAYEPSYVYEDAAVAEFEPSYGMNYNGSRISSDSYSGNKAQTQEIQTSRKIIKSGSISMEALDYDKTLEEVYRLIEDNGGYVETSNENNRYIKSRNCSIEARVPQENFDTFINGAMNAGNVTSKSVSADDVTETYVDMQSRLGVLRDEEAALRTILQSADTVEDLMYVQNRLYDVIEEIESYEARIRSYDSKINYSRISISIKEVEKETPVEEETWGQEFKRRVTESLENLWEALKGFGIGIVVVLPWLVIPAIIAIVIVVIIKTSIKRKRAKRQKAAEENLQKTE